MKHVLFVLSAFLFFGGCKNQDYLNVNYIKNQKEYTEKIKLDFISKNGDIISPYIDSVKFGYLDSLSFPDNNPDNQQSNITYKPLDFNKKIEPCSPEYYAAYTIYNIQKDLDYYNRLFDNKIDFNSQKEYRNIAIVFGNTPLLSQPKIFCFKENSKPEPSLFYHEMGHRAFWYLQDDLGVKFGGLTIIHMGLLEYFNISLNNSPIEVDEDPNHPGLFMRDASRMYKYPLDSTYTLRYTFERLKKAYKEELKDPDSDISKYLAACYSSYDDYILDNIYDNHYGGMVLASTLWRIRENLGQEKTDNLVAKTILELNQFMEMRETYYNGDLNSLSKNIDWHDVYYGLIRKDKELYEGHDVNIIENEFKKTGYPAHEIVI
ncbi:hypothetical protein SAMN05444274_107154 [Mariniphaga anaerophila]|uniref:Uncharacterized protein n=1 Tax=Mariniphaga anaerophila TaxID=1484053 RepID=A0A1M5DLH0_9BACT|nr:hypothetical protein [Mariniphaga anaerophila]SHF67823.1 hypothetical protein SAMN05444274_107154 [Mariniphaga anaerophila]